MPVAIDRLCFQSDGVLVNEFNQVFASLFDNSDHHKKIVEALSSSQKGMNRAKLVGKCGIHSGGTLTTLLQELTESGFITEYQPFENKKKNSLFRLSDEYSLFWLKFIKNNPGESWKTLYNSRSYVSWSGFVFETLCLKHVEQIKKGLGISGIDAQSAGWRNENAQIDLLIDRSDRIINICEMKFSMKEFSISKGYAETIRNKKQEFINGLTSRKNVFITFVTTFGVKENKHSNMVMDNQIKMDDLFEKL